MEKKVCIITARGGSKRIPRKNIREFCGKPILAYSIGVALDSKIFDEVMVSTDDLEIAEVAKKYGASVPFMRSAKASDDITPTAPVLVEVIEEYKKLGKNFDYLCCIYPTAPLLQKERLIEAFTILKRDNLDCVFPVLRFGFPIQRAFRMDANSHVSMIHPENLIVRSQDLEPTYQDAGQFYFMNAETLLLKKSLVTDRTAGLLLTEMEAQDIDNMEDWRLAEFKYNYRNQNLS
ncbi:pseudaminic acid cytidylyltransferase [Leptospira vanthielii]|uniref:Pseudaminic acid cytidylyltransferase n=1 Tax=Leptospira vanthielii TaxID=293085 RepID=A0ABY2NSV8_9LEPT|nr:pseudaminic acid cytidylyltransferase [Leptospira vanthielii]TGM60696.1 pseudaminic acid cytidylyltransferase [Leptospira vanthielii]